MPKGGARTRSGPPPDPNALRRERDKGDWLDLPADGREGDPPEWPLSPVASKRERTLWADLWGRPQAVAWERHGSAPIVGLYVRRFAEAERRNAPVNVSTLVRQLADELGLTESGMLRNRWRVVAGGDVEEEPRPEMSSARDRFRVVAGEGGG